MILEFKPRMSIHPVDTEYLELTENNIDAWWIETKGFCGRKTNSPNLKIKFKSGKWFAQPSGMILNYSKVVKFLKTIPKS